MTNYGNLFRTLPAASGVEVFEELICGGAFRLERIVSTGQTTPPGQWYDQTQHEWVLLLAGAARILFEDATEPVELQPGDWIHIAAHRRHRVAWTQGGCETVWLALHYSDRDTAPPS